MSFQGIIDTTLREGQQSPLLFQTKKFRFNLEEKRILIDTLIRLGVSLFEFFSPAVSDTEEKEFLELRAYAQDRGPNKIRFLAHCRCRFEDIEKSVQSGFSGLNLYMSVSKKALRFNYERKPVEIRKLISRVVAETRHRYPHLYLRFSVEDAFRTPLEDVFQVYDQIQDSVNTLGLSDTVGVATPPLVEERVRALKRRYPDKPLECHFHNDRGLALANTITAIGNGVEFVDSSIWGLGERSGIVSTTALLFNLYHIDSRYVKNYELNLCYPLNALMESMLGLSIPYSEPVSPVNRIHIAGVHQKAVIRNKSLYEGNNLEPFGVLENRLLLGPLSGWNNIYRYLKKVKNYDITEHQAKEIAREFKTRAYRVGELDNPEDLLEVITRNNLMPRFSTRSCGLGSKIDKQ
jgi:homocitrate synthase